jgi:regulator of replication initiation timing
MCEELWVSMAIKILPHSTALWFCVVGGFAMLWLWNHALMNQISALMNQISALEKKQSKDSAENHDLAIENHALKKKQSKDSAEIRTLKDEKQTLRDTFEKEARTSPYKMRKACVYNEGKSNLNATKAKKFMQHLESPKSKSKMTHCPEIGSTNQFKIESAGFNTLMAVIGVYMSMDQKGRTSQDRNDRFISWLAELGIRTDRRSTITHCIAEEAKIRFTPLKDK